MIEGDDEDLWLLCLKEAVATEATAPKDIIKAANLFFLAAKKATQRSRPEIVALENPYRQALTDK